MLPVWLALFHSTGESALVEYRFDATEIDFGKQMYDQVASAEITLINRGRVGFDFEALDMEPSPNNKPKPGCPLLIPHKVNHWGPLTKGCCRLFVTP